MTRYEQGFMNKCAEAGVPKDVAIGLLLKTAGSDYKNDNWWGAMKNWISNSMRQPTRMGKRLLRGARKLVGADAINGSVVRSNGIRGPKGLAGEGFTPSEAMQYFSSGSNYTGSGKATPDSWWGWNSNASNIVNKSILDKIPAKYHAPGMTNDVYDVLSIPIHEALPDVPRR